jgi:cell wall-associated NlpC family hydrolase
VSQLARTVSLALAVALLAPLPAGAQAANGGASAGAATAPAASTRTSGGAAPGTLVRAPARARARSRSRRRPRPRVKPVTAAAPPPTATAALLPDGTATAPVVAPAVVAAVIAAGNRIASLPYRWGGGHASWDDTGYDCSGSVGYALHGGGLLDASATSGELMSYGEAGPGAWITIYTNPDHVYMVVAGLRFDTSGARPSRWQVAPRSGAGFAVRHPPGL